MNYPIEPGFKVMNLESANVNLMNDFRYNNS